MSILSKASRRLSLFDKIDLFLGFAEVFGAAIHAAIIGPFRGIWGNPTNKHYVVHALLRKMTSRLTTAQMHHLTLPFGDIYEGWCRTNQCDPSFISLPSGCRAFWVGDKAAKNIVIYFHGGGFSFDGTIEHINFWRSIQLDLESHSKPIAFLFVEYTLAPYGKFPIQIREGVEAVQFVLKDLGRSASEITLGGDSAGGNLCLAILSHIMHPLPDIPSLVLDKPLKALLMIAPWVTFDIRQPSGKSNAFNDIFSVQSSIKWGKDYLGSNQSSNYAEPLLAPPEWWKDAHVEQILAVAGADEILVDPINEWADKFKSVNPDVLTYVVTQNEAHIAPIIEPQFGDQSETEHERAIKSWLKSRF